ncbi:MAG: hypothetical protein VW405_10495 [Rhodospirillaceae bacterium]
MNTHKDRTAVVQGGQGRSEQDIRATGESLIFWACLAVVVALAVAIGRAIG